MRSRPATFFSPDQIPMLIDYLKGMTEQEELRKAIRKLNKHEAPTAYLKLTQAESSRSRELVYAAKALRIAPASNFTEVEAGAKKRRPQTAPAGAKTEKAPRNVIAIGQGKRPWEE
jgi:hypothetical protein